MTDPDPQATAPHPPGATLHLGGDAWASPALQPLLASVTDVVTYPGNPRRHDQDGITASIRDHGLYAAVVVQDHPDDPTTTCPVIVGNGRLQALLDLGATMVPVIGMDVPDDRARAIVARDNRTSDLSSNDDRLLLDLLAEFDGDEELLALAGYDPDQVADLRALVEPPSLDDLANATPDPEDDPFVTIKVRVTPETAKLWRAARAALDTDDEMELDEGLVKAAHAALVQKAARG